MIRQESSVERFRLSPVPQRVALRAGPRVVPAIISSALPITTPRAATRLSLLAPRAPRRIAYPPAVAQALALVVAMERHPPAWTSLRQRSALKFMAGWSVIGLLTALAALAHCAQPVILLWLLLAGA